MANTERKEDDDEKRKKNWRKRIERKYGNWKENEMQQNKTKNDASTLLSVFSSYLRRNLW